MAQLITSGEVLGGVVEVVGSNLARGQKYLGGLSAQLIHLFIYCPLISIYTRCCRLQKNIAIVFQLWFLN